MQIDLRPRWEQHDAEALIILFHALKTPGEKFLDDLFDHQDKNAIINAMDWFEKKFDIAKAKAVVNERWDKG